MSKAKAVYVAGPMRGLPEFNFAAFNSAAALLRELGWMVFNPAERDMATGFNPVGLLGTDEELAAYNFSIRDALLDDTSWICRNADAIFLLPGWENSTGAVAERALGEALGLEIIEAPGARTIPCKIRDYTRTT